MVYLSLRGFLSLNYLGYFEFPASSEVSRALFLDRKIIIRGTQKAFSIFLPVFFQTSIKLAILELISSGIPYSATLLYRHQIRDVCEFRSFRLTIPFFLFSTLVCSSCEHYPANMGSGTFFPLSLLLFLGKFWCSVLSMFLFFYLNSKRSG